MSLVKANGAGDQDTGFYNGVATQSLRFEDGDSAYMSRTPSGAGNQKTWTWSGWVKKTQASTSDVAMFSANGGGDTWFLIGFSGSNTGIDVDWYNGSTRLARKFSNADFRDPAAWYHVVVAVDTTDSTADDRIKVYINSEQITSWSQSTNPSQDSDTYINSTNLHTIGKNASTSRTTYFDGYLAEVNLVDGSQLTPTSFGETKNGVWIPKKYTGSYGTNGFRLQFINTTVTGSGSSSTIGADTSGQNNHFTSSAIVASDCNIPDSPENNWCVYNPLDAKGEDNTFSEGNLKVVVEQQNRDEQTTGTFAVSSGKWYWEHRLNSTTTSDAGYFQIGLRNQEGKAWSVRGSDGEIKDGNGTTASSSVSYTTGNVIGIYLDMDNTKWYVSVDGSLQNSGNLTNGTGFLHSNIFGAVRPFILNATSGGTHTGQGNFGQDSTFSGLESAGGYSDANGNGDFHSSVFSGYLALCTANLPEPTIGPSSATQSVDHHGTLTYTSDGNAVNIVSGGNDNNGTAVGGEINFSPDWVWIKRRNNANNHQLFDTTRGTKVLQSNEYDDESDYSSYFAFLSSSNGFRLPAASANMNANGGTYVAWNWKANGGTTSSDSNGSITSTVQANTDAGFSIVTYAGTGASSATIGHGLGAVPKQIWVKNRDAAYNWKVYHAGNTTAPETDYLVLDESDKTADAVTHWNDTAPTSTVFSIGSSNALIRSGDNFVAYCFADVEGYSKFGSYTGNLNTNGTFVHTGFRPAFVLIKNADEDGYNWYMYDNARLGYNPNSIYSLANTNGTETNYSGDSVDFLSNGFKLRTLANGRGTNRNANHVYMAFAEAPFKFANAG